MMLAALLLAAAVMRGAVVMAGDKPAKCRMPMREGYCKGAYSRYYYDEARDSCRSFIYTGCGSNANHFLTREACESTCIVGKKSICTLPMQDGTCSDEQSKYYYDKARGCRNFIYSGCGGNDNNFPTREACQRYCGATYQSVCHMPKKVGPCSTWTPRFYFDAAKGMCQRFSYGGCSGNGNNFKTFKVCQKACGGNDESVCGLPKDTGPCRASTPRFYFDAAKGMCQRFGFGGCGGNKNNFQTLNACQEACGGL